MCPHGLTFYRAGKVGDRPDVARLREDAEGADGGDAVTAFVEGARVARERGGVAGDVVRVITQPFRGQPRRA